MFHWTSAEVVHWLTVYVELPQYGDVFYKLNVTGRHLPRLVTLPGARLGTAAFGCLLFIIGLYIVMQ